MNRLQLQVVLDAIDKVTGPLRKITQGSQGMARAVKEAQDKLKLLNRSQQQIDKLHALQTQSKLTSTELKAMQEVSKRLADRIAQTDQPNKQLLKQFKEAEQRVAKLTKEYDNQINKLKHLRGDLNKAGFDKLTDAQQKLTHQIKQANQALEQQQKRLSQMNKAQSTYSNHMSMRNNLVGAGMSTSIAGAAVAAPLASIVTNYAAAEDAATQLKVAMMGVGGVVSPEFEKINVLAEQLGNKLPGTTAELQSMMTMLKRQGMTDAIILGGLGEATAYLGVQMRMPYEQAAEFSAKLQDATRTTEKDMMGLMDTIQRTFYLGVDSDNMLNAFTKLSPALSILKKQGLEASNMLAPLVVMTDQAGMKGEAAGNAYRKIFQKSMDTGKVQKSLRDLKKDFGVSLDMNFTDGKGEFGGLENMFAQLQKLKGLTTEARTPLLKDIFGDDAETLQALSIMIDKGIDGYREVQGKMTAQADIQSRVNAQLGTLKNLWDAASGTFTNALVKLGEAVAPELKATAEWLGSLAEMTANWAKEHPRLAAFIIKTTAVLGGFLLVAGGLMLAISSLIGPFAIIQYGLKMFGIQAPMAANAVKSIGSAFAWVGRALLANPILLAIAVIIGALYLLWENWDTVKSAIATGWQWVCGVLDRYPILKFFPIGMLISGIRFLIENWDQLKEKMVTGWQWICSVFDQYPILNYLMPIVPLIRTVIDNFDALKAGVSAVWMQISQAFDGGLSGIGALILNWSPLGLFYQAFAGVMSYFGIDMPKKFSEFGGMIIDGLVNGLLWAFEKVNKVAGDVANMLSTTFKKVLDIKSPSRVFAEIGSFTMAGLENGLVDNQKGPLDSIIGLSKKLLVAGAGIALGLPAMGRDINIDTRPPIGTSSQGSPSASGGASYVINVYPSAGMDEAALARLVGAEIDKRERQRKANKRSRLSDYD